MLYTLGESWKLLPDPDNHGRAERWFENVPPGAVDAPVPGVIQQVFPGYHGVAWYWHTFTLAGIGAAAERPDQCARLRFGAVDYLAEVWLNGQRLGAYEGAHTLNHVPIGQQCAALPDHMRRDLINAKASGFNTVRFLAGMAWPEQLDFCDEIGLLVYEECFAGWLLADTPRLGEHFDRSNSAMIARDRNHPSVALFRNLGREGKPVFLSEYGIGSLFDVIREWRHFEQAGPGLTWRMPRGCANRARRWRRIGSAWASMTSILSPRICCARASACTPASAATAST
jgi:beta-galactosidase/beta-glucuronidase